MRFSILPDDGALKIFSNERHWTCILATLNSALVDSQSTSSNTNSVLRQLSMGIFLSTEETLTAIALRKEELERLRERDENKKDRLKKFHPSVKNMILNAFASYSMDEEEVVASMELVDSCKAFFNCENASLYLPSISIM